MDPADKYKEDYAPDSDLSSPKEGSSVTVMGFKDSKPERKGSILKDRHTLTGGTAISECM
jgi:hypothetical protein